LFAPPQFGYAQGAAQQGAPADGGLQNAQANTGSPEWNGFTKGLGNLARQIVIGVGIALLVGVGLGLVALASPAFAVGIGITLLCFGVALGLTALIITGYETFVGKDLDGNKLTTEQRWEKGTEFVGNLILTALGGYGAIKGLMGVSGGALAVETEAGADGIIGEVAESGAGSAIVGAEETAGAGAAGDAVAEAGATAPTNGARLVNCFPPSMLVGTEAGLRPIGQIGAGEAVWGYDFLSGVWRLCLVECRHDANYHGPLVTLDLGGGELTATAYHPFWVIQGDGLANRPTPRHVGPDEDQGGSLAGRWVNSHDLREGDVVFLKDRGPTTVHRVHQRSEREFGNLNGLDNLFVVVSHGGSSGIFSLRFRRWSQRPPCPGVTRGAQRRARPGLPRPSPGGPTPRI
jgi:hypothetical protein